MTPIPKIPQRLPRITLGEAQDGTEVIAARLLMPEVVVGEDGVDGEEKAAADSPQPRAGAQLGSDGVWEVSVPQKPQRHIDLTTGSEFDDDGWRAAGADLVRRMQKIFEGHPVRAKRHILQIQLPAEANAASVRSLVIGLVVGGHTFITSHTRRVRRVKKIHLVPSPDLHGAALESHSQSLQEAIDEGYRLAAATCLARDLANTPANVKSPEWFANQAKRVLRDIPGVKVKLRDTEWLERKGFGGVLAVGQGSSRPPMLVELTWDPERVQQSARRSTIAMVGKGVTFDTGGVSLKPAAGMDTMRTDMTGGACVIAAFRALAEMQVNRKVVAVIPMAENMVSGSAYRPGDVVEHYGGITTEVSNTDAEGRMLLADAVSYVAKKYQPSTIVTIATLTGAAKLALGLRTGAVFSNRWSTGVRLARRGAVVGESWWPLPQPDYLEEKVDSKIADVRQTPAGPGAITAAMFLRRFTRGIDLIHLDIAGPGRAENTYAEVTPLGTGFGARTLVQWLAK